jgi:schlafen family protein
MGRALELFIRLRARGAAEVERMIDDAVVEELFLDYKRSSTPLPGSSLHEDDKKNFAKAISGFANSEGGVIVWGVDCRQTKDGDVPTKAVPITQPIALKTLLDGALGALTLPSHSAVENIPLLHAADGDGFVVTYIPVGMHVPYQALYPRADYYIRAGSNFLPTPHSVLAGMFGRTPQPNVVPIITLQTPDLTMPNLEEALVCLILRLEVSVTNKGRAIAEDIFSVVETKLPHPSFAEYNGKMRDLDVWGDLDQGCFTLVASKLKLPPQAQQQAFTLTIGVRGEGDHILTVSFGSKGGPGAAKEIAFPGTLLKEMRRQVFGSSGDDREACLREWEPRLRECVDRDAQCRIGAARGGPAVK